MHSMQSRLSLPCGLVQCCMAITSCGITLWVQIRGFLRLTDATCNSVANITFDFKPELKILQKRNHICLCSYCLNIKFIIFLSIKCKKKQTGNGFVYLYVDLWQEMCICETRTTLNQIHRLNSQ